MDYLGDKLNSATGSVLSNVNEIKRKRKQAKMAASASSQANQMQLATQNTGFGGDSSFAFRSTPPPIGFVLGSLSKNNQNTSGRNLAPGRSPSQTQLANPPVQQPSRLAAAESSESLYQADGWARLWFQRVMLLTLVRLMLFVRKVYEDFQATKTYSASATAGHFLTASLALFLPTIVFTLYRVCRYLQINFAIKRATTKPETNSYGSNQHSSEQQAANIQQPNTNTDVQEASHPLTQVATSYASDDDGLVTARQSPTNLEEFHDSSSQQAVDLGLCVSPAPSTALVKDSPQSGSAHSRDHNEQYLARVKIHKLGNLSDSTTTRIIIGASEQLLHGVLFVFWQVKRQVDVLSYLVERSCLWRKPRPDELDEIERLRTGSDGLEWFQDFYAAFIAILSQVYIIGTNWSKPSPVTTSALHSALSAPASSDGSSDSIISGAARTLSNTLSQRGLADGAVEGRDLLIMSQLIVSMAVVSSLLVAVRRRDDGPLTLGLSMSGWGSIFGARIIVIALSFAYIGWPIMSALVACHVIAITGWIYKIALDSHNLVKDETEEHKWSDDADEEEGGRNDSINKQSLALADTQERATVNETPKPTDVWTLGEHLVLIIQILTLFSLPSLFYWPIMFNLKLHYRPFKYLVLILSENFILIPAIWFAISSSGVATPGQWYMLGAVGALSIVGFILIALYVACKPSLTEYFARADQLLNDAESSGIYYEFCSRVFRMPDLSRSSFTRLMNQTEEVQEQTQMIDS